MKLYSSPLLQRKINRTKSKDHFEEPKYIYLAIKYLRQTRRLNNLTSYNYSKIKGIKWVFLLKCTYNYQVYIGISLISLAKIVKKRKLRGNFVRN